MKFISSNVPCGTTTNACDPCGTYELEGCAAGVPYAQLVSISTGTATTRWINLDTGEVVDAKPTGFLTGACAGAAENSLAFSAASPTATVPFASPKDNYTTFVTADGTSAGTITEMWKYDLDSATWVQVPLGAAAADLISTDAGNTLVEGTDGKLYVAAQALFDDDQVLTGDTTTNATVTLTPTTVPDPANPTVDQVNYVVKVEVKVDGTTIVEDPVTKVLSAADQTLDVLADVQPTPTATGNTTNLNSTFKDAAGDTWIVDGNGDAIQAGGAAGAPVTVGSDAPTGTSIEGAIHLVTDDGTPTGTVLEQYIYDADSGVWIEMQRNAQDTLKFGTAAPTAPGEWDGEEFFVTSDGTAAGTVTAQHIWDRQSASWVLRPSGGGASLDVLTTAQPTPTATGNTTNLNTSFVDVNGDTWIVDSNGDAIKTGSGAAAVGGQNVYFDAVDPSLGTIFDTANPPVTNDDALKADSANTYYGVDGSVWTWNGTAYITKTYSYPTHQTPERFTATAGQTVFTLSKTPVGKVWGFRNGVEIALAFTNVGATVTYAPAQNSGMTMDAGDWVDFHYEAL